MRPTLRLDALKKLDARDYAVRFVFGGVVTLCAGLVAREWGPVIGGLFLAFPSILPASLTLVDETDGRTKAVDDARGARLGSVGLVAFALAVWLGARSLAPAPLLLLATLAWAVVDVGLWLARDGAAAR